MAEQTWNNWRTTLNDQDGASQEQTNTNPGGEDDLDALFPEYGQEQENEGTQEPETPPATAGLSAEQLEQILARQNEQYAAQQRETMQMLGEQFGNRQAPESFAPTIEAPSPRDIRRAFEEGDYDRYFELQSQADAAKELAHRREIDTLAGAAAQRLDELSSRMIQSQPDYVRYKTDVEKLMDEINMPQTMRGNPQLVSILVDAAKGRNIDRELEERVTARRRQRQRPESQEPTPDRQNRGGRGNEPVFTSEAMEALRLAGRSPDRHAQAWGYANWAEYEKATQAKYANWDEINVPAWRRRMNSGRNTTA